MKPRLFSLASKLAQTSTHKFQLGCIIAKGNRILGMGKNQARYHKHSPHPFKTLHAECSALLSCGPDKAKGADVYVYRATKDGNNACSKPCPCCIMMLKEAGVRRIYYTKNEYPFWDVLDKVKDL